MSTTTIFGRFNSDGDVEVFEADGSVCTQIDANVYPVGSGLSARYEHPEGLVLSPDDAGVAGVVIED